MEAPFLFDGFLIYDKLLVSDSRYDTPLSHLMYLPHLLYSFYLI